MPTPEELNELIRTGKVCPYCLGVPEHVDSKEIYGKSFGMVYLCRRCNAYVGCHKSDQAKALGRLADATLRKKKKAAHAAFDPLWQSGEMTRPQAYEWLAGQLGLPVEHTHIGMFSVSQCEVVIEYCSQHKP